MDVVPCASAGTAAAAPAPTWGESGGPSGVAWGDGLDMGDVGLIPWAVRQAGVTWDDDILDVTLMKESYERAE